MTQQPDPVAVLRRIALLLTVTGEPSFRSRTFRRAAITLGQLTNPELLQLAAAGRLREIEGVGPVVERVVKEVLAGQPSHYLERLEEESQAAIPEEAWTLLQALRGDCHTHSDWSDGRAPIETMMNHARSLGHDYAVLTDHSPRLTIANGLSAERLLQELDVVEALNHKLTPFSVLTGIETDILLDGGLDQEDALLGRLDIVVASVHSQLRMPAEQMTPRLVQALSNPRLEFLGHCTGRLITGRGRPQSQFDADVVFAACARYDKAIEINCRPERLDPPPDLLRKAVEAGCRFAINTDAHTPEELEWQLLGCKVAAECGITVDAVVNAMSRDDLLAWAASHDGGGM